MEKNKTHHPAPNTTTFFFPSFSCLVTVCINRLEIDGCLNHDRNISIKNK